VGDSVKKGGTKRLGPFNDQSIGVVFRSKAKLGRDIAIGVEGSVVGSTKSGDSFTEELEGLLESANDFT
jgi:hypothetical protein